MVLYLDHKKMLMMKWANILTRYVLIFKKHKK